MYNTRYYTWRWGFIEKYNKILSKNNKDLVQQIVYQKVEQNVQLKVQQELQQKVNNNYVLHLVEYLC